MTSAPVPVVGLVRQTTAEEVASVIREMIMAGELEPGAALREAALSQQFGVSRRAIREAISILSHEGIVSHHRHRGARVAELEPDDIRDLYRIRATMELAAAAESARAGAVARQQLDLAFAALQDATTLGHAPEIVLRDLEFHRAIVGLLGSRRFNQFFAAISVEMRYALTILETTYRESMVRPDEALEEHRAIYDALRSGDAALAYSLIDAHIDENAALLLRAV